MKKLTTTLFAMAFCQERFNPTVGSEVAYDVPKYVEPSWNEGDYELCPKKQWLEPSKEMTRVPRVRALADPMWITASKPDDIILRAVFVNVITKVTLSSLCA